MEAEKTTAAAEPDLDRMNEATREAIYAVLMQGMKATGPNPPLEEALTWLIGTIASLTYSFSMQVSEQADNQDAAARELSKIILNGVTEAISAYPVIHPAGRA